MTKASLITALGCSLCLLAGCTVVYAEGDPEPSPHQPSSPGAAGENNAGGAASGGEGGEGVVVANGGAGDIGGASGAGGAGGSTSEVSAGAGGQGGAAEQPETGLGAACADETTCVQSAPECPAAAGFCTFYCDESWINGWQAVPAKVAKCEELGGACTPIGEERSYCVP